MDRNFVYGIVAGAAVSAAALAVVRSVKSQNSPETPTRKSGLAKKYSEELIREQLARNYGFLGEAGMASVRKQNIVVVGVGGVGSWVATMLVRSGVSKIKIIDFDQVSLSSLNRHAVATLRDVGQSKVEVLKHHLLEIAPWCEIEACNELWNIDGAQRLLGSDLSQIDYVVDCIDNLDTKVDLLTYCHNNGVPVVSSGGAACKSDPTRVNVGDIHDTEEDALMKSVRRVLKKRGISTGITVVFSAEKPDPRKASLLPLPEEEFEKGRVDELSALQNFRVRILPVLGSMPGMFALAIVSHILTTVGGYPVEPVLGKNRKKSYESVFLGLAGQQTRLGEEQIVPVSVKDVQYLVEEVFRGKSAVSGYSTKLAVTRWRRERVVSIQNLVVMTKEEVRKHEQEVLLGGKTVESVYPKEVLDLVEKRFQEELYYSRFR